MKNNDATSPGRSEAKIKKLLISDWVEQLMKADIFEAKD